MLIIHSVENNIALYW